MAQRFLCALAVLLAGASAGAESTRTLQATLSTSATAPFTVENLAGTMSVRPGADGEVTAVATIHAEDATLAAEVRLEQVTDEGGRPALRVIYPLPGRRTVRYPSSHGTSQVTYAGRRVVVSSSRGDVLWADVEVRVPAAKLDAVFRNAVGALTAERLRGRVLLDSSSGSIKATELSGEVKADTGSGDVEAEGLAGSFTCDTGSGGCRVTAFDGDTLSCDTGSGDVQGTRVRAARVVVDTGSGRVSLREADVEVFEGDTGSGGILLENTGARLRRVDADTGSGGVTVRLPATTGFELRADVGSGDISCGFDDARAIVHHRTVVGYERGDRRVKITADTGSGGVTVDPLR
jgi:hypothetical protein